MKERKVSHYVRDVVGEIKIRVFRPWRWSVNVQRLSEFNIKKRQTYTEYIIWCLKIPFSWYGIKKQKKHESHSVTSTVSHLEFPFTYLFIYCIRLFGISPVTMSQGRGDHRVWKLNKKNLNQIYEIYTYWNRKHPYLYRLKNLIF